MKISKEYLPTIDMENCCNEHDLCYDTCNNDKQMCDLDYRRCLLKICERASVFGEIGVKGIIWCETRNTIGGQQIINSLLSGCKLAANTLFSTTVTLGCKSYQDSQAKSCYCPAEEKYYTKYEKKGGKNREL